MDSDAAQKDNDQHGKDIEMGDAPSQDTGAPAPASASQAAPSPHTNLKFAPPSSDPDLTSPANQTTTDLASSTANPNNTILETTEKPAESQKMAPKKKGTAAIKKAPKRSKGSGPRAGKSKKQAGDNATNAAAQDDEPMGGSDEESDNGPYCICRGPDDHRFMIGCDVCEDWFHGECINISKEVGEHLIERFVCPVCTEKDPRQVSLFKKTCAWKNCMKPARLYDGEPKSNFCSNEHKDMFWEARISAMPAMRTKRSSKNADPQDELFREELMTLLTSELASVDPSDGRWKFNTRPFAPPAAGAESPEAKHKTVAPSVLTEEEEKILKDSAAERYKKGEEVVLCQKMLQLMEMANDRRKSLIASKKLDDAACGYDFRLDQVGVAGPFAHWLNSDEAKEIFKAGNLEVGSHLSGEEKNICDKKRCKAHQGWFSIHTRDVRYQMKVLAEEANKLLDRERFIKEAAAERKRRKEAECNSVQVVGPDGTLLPPEPL